MLVLDAFPSGEVCIFSLMMPSDVLDYKDALAKLPHAKSIVEEGGTHPFDGIERHFENIRDFLVDTV